MKNFTFLAVQGPDDTTASLAPLAEAATRHGGRLGVLHIGPVPILAYAMGISPYGGTIVPDGWIAERNEMARKLADHQTKTRAYLLEQGLTGEVSTLCVEPAALHNPVALRGLFADITIIQDSLRAYSTAFDDVVYGLLFESPGPVMLNVMPNGKALAPQNVLVAWNSSLPAARAVRAALPLLKAAKEVTIACFDADRTAWRDGDSPGTDLAAWLSHHGCRITVQDYKTGHSSVSDAILDRAREHGADLIVMGAYGRHRWNERLFGGTTLSMIQQRERAVFLAH